jgi:hypothetical protein
MSIMEASACQWVFVGGGLEFKALKIGDGTVEKVAPDLGRLG